MDKTPFFHTITINLILIFDKNTSAMLRCSWIVKFLLLICMSGIILTGLMIAKTLPFRLSPWANAKVWHYFFAAVSIVLMGIHIGMHWSFIKAMVSKVNYLPRKLGMPISILLLTLAVVWGSFSLVTGSFARWICGPFTVSSFLQGELTDKMNESVGNGEHRKEVSNIEGDMSQQEPNGPGQGQRNGEGAGKKHGKGYEKGPGFDMAQSFRFQNVFNVIITYGSEMVVFSFLTAFICYFGKRCKQKKRE